MQRSDPRRFSENRVEKPTNPALESIATGMGFTGAASSGVLPDAGFAYCIGREFPTRFGIYCWFWYE